MASWSNMRTRITASVRTTSRMNALLSESMINKRRSQLKLTAAAAANAANDATECEQSDELRSELLFSRNNFNMERVYKLIEVIVEDRMTWDRLSRSYDSWRSLQLAEGLAADIRDGVKRLMNYQRHRIVCILSVIEKQNQGFNASMCHLLDPQMDNFTKYIYERPTFVIVITLFLVYKD